VEKSRSAAGSEQRGGCNANVSCRNGAQTKREINQT
jgi:hypothetical protein